MKNYLVFTVLAFLSYGSVSAQTCYTPITSWQVNYSLSGSGTGACADGQSGATCTTSEAATGADSYTMAVVSCGSLQWGPTNSGTVTSGSVNNKEQYQCQTNPPIQEIETDVGSGGAAGPAFGQTFLTINTSGTYSFEPFPYGNAKETLQGCSNTTSNAAYPLYPNTNWPQTFTLPSSLQPLVVSNFGFQAEGGLNLSVPWTFSFNLTPNYDSDDDCNGQWGPGFPASSSVDCLNQSLGEDLAIVGTGFNLHYESDRTPGAGGNSIAIAAASMVGGWTFDVFHAYDPGSNTLFLGDGTQRNGQQLGTPVSYNGNLLLTSDDGSEVYVVTTGGKPLARLKPMTGAVEYQFGYDAAGQLITITDGSGNVTTIQRNASEHPTAIVAPFGQTTTLTLDSNGFLSKMTDPLGLSQTFTNTGTGLLISRTDANGNIFNYTYDRNGRLINDADPLGGFVAASRTNASSGFGYTVSQTTSMGRTSTFQNTLNLPWVQNGTSPSTEQHNNTWPNGLHASSSSSLQSGQLSNSVTLPDGTSQSETLGPDPRWGTPGPGAAQRGFDRGQPEDDYHGQQDGDSGRRWQSF